MQVVHKPDSQLVWTGTAPRMSITSNMMSVSAAGRPCANLQEERTHLTGWVLLGCSRAQWINCLHGLMVTLFHPGLQWLGFDPDLVPSSAGGDQNISLVAITDPLKWRMWWAAASLYHAHCSVIFRVRKSRAVDSPVACLVHRHCKQEYKHSVSSQQLFIS